MLETGTRATDVTHTFFSHLHYDHFVDFPRLLLTRWDTGAARIPELKVFGPQPIKRLVEGLIGREGVFGPDLTARTNWDSSLHVYRARGGKEPRLPPAPEVREIGSGDVIETDRWRIQVAEVPHAQPYLACLAYRIDLAHQNMQTGQMLGGLVMLGLVSAAADRGFATLSSRLVWWS